MWTFENWGHLHPCKRTPASLHREGNVTREQREIRRCWHEHGPDMREYGPAHTLLQPSDTDSEMLVYRTMRDCVSVVLSQHASSNLLQNHRKLIQWFFWQELHSKTSSLFRRILSLSCDNKTIPRGPRRIFFCSVLIKQNCTFFLKTFSDCSELLDCLSSKYHTDTYNSHVI